VVVAIDDREKREALQKRKRELLVRKLTGKADEADEEDLKAAGERHPHASPSPSMCP
jgi:hypothetical protein